MFAYTYVFVSVVCQCRVNERGTVKVADFGLSRELLLRDYYRSDGNGLTPVPVRWLAPESLEASVFTTMSDVVRHHYDNIDDNACCSKQPFNNRVYGDIVTAVN